MRFNTDNGGFATKCNDIKIFHLSSTWATKLSQLAKTSEELIIMTNGFQPRIIKDFTENIEDEHSYIRNILDKRPNNIFIICNTNDIKEAKIIKQLYPNIRISYHNKVSANIALLGPQTVLFSSNSFGYSSNDEFGVGFHSVEIYNKMKDIFRKHWLKATEI